MSENKKGKNNFGCCSEIEEAIGQFVIATGRILINFTGELDIAERTFRTQAFQQFLFSLSARIRLAFNELIECTNCKATPCCGAAARAIANVGIGYLELAQGASFSLGNPVVTPQPPPTILSVQEVLDNILNTQLEATLEIILREACRDEDCDCKPCEPCKPEKYYCEDKKHQCGYKKYKCDEKKYICEDKKHQFYNYVEDDCYDKKYYDNEEYYKPIKKCCDHKTDYNKPCTNKHNEPYYKKSYERKNEKSCRLFDEKQKKKYYM